MNMYEAFMRAADFVEANPDRYNINYTAIPTHDGPGSQGCMWGWAGYFFDEGLRGRSILELARQAKKPDSVILHHPALGLNNDPKTGERLNLLYAAGGVRVMRLIAETFYGHLKPGVLPAVAAAEKELDPSFVAWHESYMKATSAFKVKIPLGSNMVAEEMIKPLAMAA